jgi:hypothetical protein
VTDEISAAPHDRELTSPRSRSLMRPISLEELAQLRQGTLDFARVAYWSETARGLAAPSPPAEGPLIAHDGRGWLLSACNVDGWLRGKPISPGKAFLISAGYLPAWLLEPLALKFGAIAIVGVSFVALERRRSRPRRRFMHMAARLPPVVATPPLAEVAEGSAVRVVGVIAPGPTIPSLFGGIPCVLSRNALASADELRGLDFTLQLEDGQRISVSVRDAHLMNQPEPLDAPPVCGPVAVDPRTVDDPRPRLISALHRKPPMFQRRRRPREFAVGPGDKVEVVGIIHHEVAPDGVAAPGRHTPMRRTLRGGPATPLLVRKT